MRLLLILVVGIILCARGQVIVEQSTPFTHSAILDPRDKVELRWKYNDTYIVFELKTKTLGWMAMGISPSGSMAGADIAAMWVDSGGKAVVKDLNSPQNGVPLEDMKQDLDLVSSQMLEDSIVVTFGRKLKTCDEDDNDITEDTLRVLYAYGTGIPSTGSLTFDDKHLTENRGSKSLRFLGSKQLPEPTDDGIEVLEVTNDKVTLPAEQTYYHCRIHKLELGGRKNHVVKMEPIIQAGNEMHYHHVLVYLCSGFNSSEHANAHGQECYTWNMPDEYGKCSTLIFAWAIGGTTFTFPNDVGLPLDDSDEPVFVMTETHYDNPDKLSDVTDSSGVRFHYTPNVRSIDAGIILLGETVSPLHFIPAGQKKWTTFSECDGKCLAESFPEGQKTIKIFATLLHSHLFGVQMKLRHFRNGVELKPIVVDGNYDFNYQEFSLHETEIEFQKGDGFAVECVYDTSNSNVPIFGGEGTNEEMCVAFVQYYPKIDTFACWSIIDGLAAKRILSVDIDPLPEIYYDEFIPAVMEAVGGRTGNQSTLNQEVLDAQYYEWCNNDFIYAPKNHSIYTPYTETESECNSALSLNAGLSLLVLMATLVGLNNYNLQNPHEV